MALQRILTTLSLTRALTSKNIICVTPISKAPWLRNSQVFISIESSNDVDGKQHIEEGHWVTMEGHKDFRPSNEKDDEDDGGLDINTEIEEVDRSHGLVPTRPMYDRLQEQQNVSSNKFLS